MARGKITKCVTYMGKFKHQGVLIDLRPVRSAQLKIKWPAGMTLDDYIASLLPPPQVLTVKETTIDITIGGAPRRIDGRPFYDVPPTLPCA